MTATAGLDKSEKKASNGTPEQRLMTLWQRYGGTTLGRKLFSFFLGRTVPYSGNIKAEVIKLTPGKVTVQLKDRRSLRNHLNCVHAIALANLGELSSGLAMLSALPPNTRSIVVKIEIEYLKKARGLLTAEGTASPPERINEAIDSIALADIINSEGDVVSRVKVHWRLSPKEAS